MVKFCHYNANFFLIGFLIVSITLFSGCADLHLAKGKDEMKAGHYQNAKEQFLTVIIKYPNSYSVAAAKDYLVKVEKEIEKREDPQVKAARKEKEKYRMKEKSEVLNEWKMFRRNPKQYRGVVTTWKLKDDYSSFDLGSYNGNSSGDYDSFQSCDVAVGVDILRSWLTKERNLNRKVEKEILDAIFQADYVLSTIVEQDIKKDDWVAFTGMFIDVTEDGEPLFCPIKIKNLGYED